MEDSVFDPEKILAYLQKKKEEIMLQSPKKIEVFQSPEKKIDPLPQQKKVCNLEENLLSTQKLITNISKINISSPSQEKKEQEPIPKPVNPSESKKDDTPKSLNPSISLNKKLQNIEPKPEKYIFEKFNSKNSVSPKKPNFNFREAQKSSKYRSNSNMPSCISCKKSLKKEFITPRCTQHKFCENCFKQGSIKIRCDYCFMYFESLKRDPCNNSFICSMCKLYPTNTGIKCESHFYCRYCFDFLVRNDFSHLVLIMSCRECKTSLEAIKDKNSSKHDLDIEPVAKGFK